jgi:hypothetical protein
MNKPWNWYGVAENPNIMHTDKIKFRGIQYLGSFSDYTHIEVQYASLISIQDNIHIYSGYPDDLSKNKNITYEFVCAHPDVKWNWIELSSIIPIETIFNTNAPWVSIGIFKNPQMNISHIHRRPLTYWNWYQVSKHKSVTFDIIISESFPWDWRGVSCNPNITWEIITANPHLPWDWTAVSYNPNLTWETIYTRSNWDWTMISANTFGK